MRNALTKAEKALDALRRLRYNKSETIPWIETEAIVDAAGEGTRER
jgi:hypothetical protein